MFADELDPFLPILALLLSSATLFIWAVLFGQHCGLRKKHERRKYISLMYAVGLLAAAGTFASAIGFSISSGLFDPPGDLRFEIQGVASFVASVGRGALLMSGLYLLMGGDAIWGDHRG